MVFETKHAPYVDYEEILAMRGTPDDRWLFIDIRPQVDFMEGHVPGSIHIPVEDLDRYLPAIRQGAYHKRVAIVSDNHEDALYTFDHLEARQFPEVLILKGGFESIRGMGPDLAKDQSAYSIERQARFVYGAMGLAGVILALLNPWWLILPAAVSLGLMMDGFTGVCPLESLIVRLPFNREK